jgi:hypothetical protein
MIFIENWLKEYNTPNKLGWFKKTIKIIFSKKMLDDYYRLIFFSGMLVTYYCYLRNEFALISLTFNYLSFSFDLCTSGLSFLSIKEFFKEYKNGK